MGIFCLSQPGTKSEVKTRSTPFGYYVILGSEWEGRQSSSGFLMVMDRG